MAGALSASLVQQRRMEEARKAAAASNPLVNQFKLYESGVKQQAGDYDKIMEGYGSVLDTANARGAANTTPSLVNYAPSADYTAALGNLRNLSNTGGFSPDDVSDLRERSISPIRAVYANMMRELNRTKALQGGYSPSFNATSAKMAREMSSLLSDKTRDANASIAEMMARNRVGLAPQLTATTQRENEFKTGVDSSNADRMNTVPAMAADNDRIKLAALSGQQSLYGTTPALSNLFGAQAMQGAEFANKVGEQNVVNDNATYRSLTGSVPTNVPQYRTANLNLPGSPLRRIYNG